MYTCFFISTRNVEMTSQPSFNEYFDQYKNADMSNTNNFPFYRISLNVMTLKVTSTHVNSVQGVPISVTGIAQVRNIFSSCK